MEKTLKDYAAFERAMNEDKLYLKYDFKEICQKIGADQYFLNELIIGELGFSGQALVDYYYSNFRQI